MARRRDGPVEKMQKGDLVLEIKKIYSELPKSWASFKRPELQALLTEMFARHRELHEHGTRRAAADHESLMARLLQNTILTVGHALHKASPALPSRRR